MNKNNEAYRIQGRLKDYLKDYIMYRLPVEALHGLSRTRIWTIVLDHIDGFQRSRLSQSILEDILDRSLAAKRLWNEYQNA